MAAIIFGVTAVALLSALAFPDSGDALSKQSPPVVTQSSASAKVEHTAATVSRAEQAVRTVTLAALFWIVR